MSNSTPPTVSIHVPAYNAEATIALALASLLHQTHESWEAIVVDDGSVDQTGNIVKSFSDTRIRYFRLSRNSGRGYARQKCLEKSKGEFVAFLDADDFYHPKKLELQLNCFHKNPGLDLVSCRMGSVNSSGQLGRIRPAIGTNPLLLAAGQRFPFPRAPSMLRSAVLVGRSYDPKLNFAEDTVLLEAALTRRWIHCLPAALYYYTEHQSVSKGKLIAMSLGGLQAKLRHHNIKSAYWWKDLGSRTTKTVAKLALYPFVSENFYLDRRGLNPPHDELEQFAQTVSTLRPDKVETTYGRTRDNERQR